MQGLSPNPIIRIGKAGTGTYGVVYTAETLVGTDQIKSLVVKRNIVDDTADFSGSIKEMDLLVRLRGHPHIVKLESVSFGNPFGNPLTPLTDRELKEDYLYFIFERATMDGSRLLLRIGSGTFPMLGLKTIFGQILLAVEYLHAFHIYHRDLKPANLLWFSETKTIKLCDFGLSKIGSFQEPSTPKAVTSWYRAPEIILGYPKYTEKVDIWSVGCIFFEFMTGRAFLQHSREDSYSLLQKIVSQYPEPLTEELLVRMYQHRKIERPPRAPRGVRKVVNPVTIEEEIQELLEISNNPPNRNWGEGGNRNWERVLRLSATIIKEFNRDRPSSFTEFTELLSKLLCFDPDRRATATQALDSIFFDFMREEITRCRQFYPPQIPPPPLISIRDSPERKSIIGLVVTIFNNREHLSWYRHRMIFQAVDLFDRYLLYLSTSINTDPGGSEEKAISRFLDHWEENRPKVPSSPLRDDRQIRDDSIVPPMTSNEYINQLRFMICLYVAIKFFLNLSIVPAFPTIVSDEYCNPEALELAGEIEYTLIRKVCNLIVYRETIFESIDRFDFSSSPLPLSEEKIRDLLIFYITLPTTSGLTTREILKFYLTQQGRNVSPVRIAYPETSPDDSAPHTIDITDKRSGPSLKVITRI